MHDHHLLVCLSIFRVVLALSLVAFWAVPFYLEITSARPGAPGMIANVGFDHYFVKVIKVIIRATGVRN